MDPNLIAAIQAFAAIGVAFAIKVAFEVTGVDLGEFTAAATTLVAGVIVAFIGNLLAQVPLVAQPLVVYVLILVLGVLGSFFSQKNALAYKGKKANRLGK